MTAATPTLLVPALWAVTVKFAELDPAGTLTVAGTVATEVLELDRVTTTPPAPAAEVRVTVPVAVWPTSTMNGLTESEANAAGSTGGVDGGGFTVIAKFAVTPEYDAVSVTGVDADTLPLVVMLNVTDVDPCGTVTLAGTVAAVLELRSDTVAPPVPAADVRVTVPVPDWPPVIVLGLTEMLLSVGDGLAGGLTVRANVLLTLFSDAVIVAGVDVAT